MIYSIASDYYLNIERNLPKALEYGQQAIRQKPSQVELYLQLARLQLLNRQSQKALKTLATATQKDRNGIHTDEIRTLKRLARRMTGNGRSQLQ